MPRKMDALALPVFRENLMAICTQERRLWIWVYPWISIDISMDMDGKFHIHGKPGRPMQ